MEFNPDGTIKPIKLDPDGVGVLGDRHVEKSLKPMQVKVSSERASMPISVILIA